MSETTPNIVSQLYCQKAKVNTKNDRLTWRTIVLVVENKQHMIYYYDGTKFINKFGPLTSVIINFISKGSKTPAVVVVDHLARTSDSPTSNGTAVHDEENLSYKFIVASGGAFMTLYLKHDDYKKDPLQLQKKNVENFISKLITTMPMAG